MKRYVAIVGITLVSVFALIAVSPQNSQEDSENTTVTYNGAEVPVIEVPTSEVTTRNPSHLVGETSNLDPSNLTFYHSTTVDGIEVFTFTTDIHESEHWYYMPQ